MRRGGAISSGLPQGLLDRQGRSAQRDPHGHFDARPTERPTCRTGQADSSKNRPPSWPAPLACLPFAALSSCTARGSFKGASRGPVRGIEPAERGGQRARAALVPPQPNRWQHTPPFSVLRTKGSLRLLGMATGHSHPNILARLFVARNEAFRRVDVGVKLHGTAFLGSRGVGWPARPGCGGACTAARDCRCGAGLPRLHFPLTLLLLPWLSGASPSSSHSTRPLLLPSLQPICFWQANDLTLLRGASRVRQQQQAVRAWA